MKMTKPEKTIRFSEMEKDILAKWNTEKTFAQSLERRRNAQKYNFYDGPPFATGLPHFGHFVPGAIKDAFPRYFTMKGFSVPRRFGWDCHGVPVELLVQKELGLNGKQDIEEFGVAQFNQACRESVLRYTEQWREYTQRLGRWVDMDNEYRTMDLDFMERVWHVFQKLWDKNLIYEGKFVVSYSTALGTTLSNFEASLDYRDVQDPSLTIKAKLTGRFAGSFLLVWTTTPWTLPANVAIVVNPRGTYIQIQDKKTEETYILLKDLVSQFWSSADDYVIEKEFLGTELERETYEPFFPYKNRKADDFSHFILTADFVLSDVGTGAVHCACAFGEDDFSLHKKYGLPLVDHLDSSGRFTDEVLSEWAGVYFKDADKLIIQNLKQRNILFRHETSVHAYPFCYRSGTPLIYRAVPSWFVKVEENRDLLKNSNEQIHWVPEHIKKGRFGKWLENARDWNIGRSRYWGNPLPIWKNDETGEVRCVGSRKELEKIAGRKITDLHVDSIDDIQIPSEKNPGTFLKRVPFVLDCWFESGSMPYAQAANYLEDEAKFANDFPADFICEGIDQTRGWFYTLNILSSLLFQKPAFKNVVVNGLVLASDGKKMSKSLKNFPDPMGTLDEYGADAIRLFLLSSPATTAEEVRFSIEGVKESTRKILLPLWNAYSFLSTYAAVEDWDPQTQIVSVDDPLDRWIQCRLKMVSSSVDQNMQHYQIAKVMPIFIEFFDDLNNWYIRRSRRRFWSGDKAAFSTLFQVLRDTSQLIAPFAPFCADYFYRKLSSFLDDQVKSVHLTDLMSPEQLSEKDEELISEVQVARKVVELGRNIRVAHKIKNRQPLQSMTVGVLKEQTQKQILKMQQTICEELNVKTVHVTADPSSLARIFVKPNFKTLGKTLGPKIKELKAALEQINSSVALQAFQKQPITVGEFYLNPEDVIVELRSPGDQLVATDVEFVVALDSTITDDLKCEGTARELVSIIQKTRRQAEFQVEERILLTLRCDAALQLAIDKNQKYIEEETLSTILDAPLTSPEMQVSVNIDGFDVDIALSAAPEDKK